MFKKNVQSMRGGNYNANVLERSESDVVIRGKNTERTLKDTKERMTRDCNKCLKQ